eukprot:4858389-Prymnesium_polylepis.4
MCIRDSHSARLLTADTPQVLEPHDLHVCKEWVAQDTAKDSRRGATAVLVDEYGETLLCLAAACGCVPLVGALLEAGANAASRKGGCTALHAATAMEQPEILGMLISAGAPIDAQDTLGRSVLRVACEKNGREVRGDALHAS